jgi:hypothetical protein
MFLVAGTVAGLALYTSIGVNASIPGLPEAVSYLPADCQAVFGMNVKNFIASPVYARFEEKHGREFGADLAEFITKTGVDPRRDVSYVIAAVTSHERGKGKGVAIAVGRFNSAAITTFINTKGSPIEVNYKDAKVLMIPEDAGNRVEKGIAFLTESEMALGDLESLKAVLDVRGKSAPGIESNATLWPLLNKLDSDQMFWFAGDAASILSKAPTTTPFGNSISAIQNVVGTLNLTDVVSGNITATARDATSAQRIADVVKGFIALGQLAMEQNTELTELMKGVSITQLENEIRLDVSFSIDLLERLENARPALKKVV